jgi:hypothetical protein
VNRYETIDFVMSSDAPPPVRPDPTPRTHAFQCRDGSRLEVLNEKTGSFRVVTPGDPVDFYGFAQEIVYSNTLSGQFFASRAN